MKPRVAFTIADDNNVQYFDGLRNSLRKFHSAEELPLLLIAQDQLNRINDKQKFYRMTPHGAKSLCNEYETVIKLDVDQIITGNLSHIWEGEFDVAVVQNSNPREVKKLQVGVWDINPMIYVNCGLVVMKSKKFIDHWWNLCMSAHFDKYQFREQDLLNILVFYGDYKVKFLDASDKFHGLASKGYWPMIKMKGDKLILPTNAEWPTDGDKEICVLHWAGGNMPNKMNYRLHFKPDVVKRLDYLVSDKK